MVLLVLCAGVRAGSKKASRLRLGSFRKLGVPYFGVLIRRILVIQGTIVGSPIFGNSAGRTFDCLSFQSVG